MTAPYSTGYNPYDDEELRKLQMLYPRPDDLGAPIPGQTPDMAPTPEPTAPVPAPIVPLPSPSPAPTPAPLDFSMPSAAPQKGMATAKVETQGVPDYWQKRLEDVHTQLTAGKLDQIEANRKTEEIINQRGIGNSNARGIEAANQEVYKQRELQDSQRKQAELRKAQDEWSQKKIDGSASKAFEGNEWAQVLTAIGMAAGTFSQAMGWQKTNPLGEAFDKTIERSIESQKEQKNSRLNQLSARLGDEKAAELQVRGELHDAIATRVASQAQGTQYQDALDRLGPMAQDQALKAQEAQAASMERLAPKQTVTQAPVKAAGPKSMKQLLEDQEAGQQLRQGKVSALMATGMSQEQADEAVDKYMPNLAPYRGQTTAQREKGAERAEGREVRGEQGADKLAKDMQAVEDLRIGLDQVYLKGNIERGDDGKLRQKPGTEVPGLANSGLGITGSPLMHALHPFGVHSNTLGLDITLDPAATQAMEDPKIAQMVGATQNAIDILGRMRSGGAIGEAEAASFQKMLLGTTPESFLANMQQFDDFVEQKREQMVRSASPEARAQYLKRGESAAVDDPRKKRQMPAQDGDLQDVYDRMPK